MIPRLIRNGSRLTTLGLRTLSSSIVLPPRVPRDADGEIVDLRRGKRTKLIPDKKFDGFKETFRFELADPEDVDMCCEFFTDEFLVSANIVQLLKMTYEELYPIQLDMLTTSIPTRGAFLIFADDKLAFLYSNSIYQKQDVRKLFPKLPGPTKFVIKDDYGEDVASRAYSYKANMVFCFLEACFSQVGSFIPDDHENFVVGECAVAAPRYLGKSPLAAQIMKTSSRYFQDNNCNYIAGVCVATRSRKVYEQFNIKSVAVFPYDKFVVNGTTPFLNPPDGTKYASLHVGPI